MSRSRRPYASLAVLAVALLAPAVLWAVLPLGTSAQSDRAELENRAERERSRERSLADDVAELNRIVDKLAGDIALLRRRQAEVQADLDREREELYDVQRELGRERARVNRLRKRLSRSRGVLGTRLSEVYRSPPPDVLTVILTSNGFADLLERTEFLRRINDQDKRIIRGVRRAKRDAQVAARRLAQLEDRQQKVVFGVQARAEGLRRMGIFLASKQESLARARAARVEALGATRANRREVERQIERLRAEEQREATSTSGPPGAPLGSSDGPWAIPWAIVQCESGGQNFPPNSAEASGYYQIIPSTWRGFGGRGPHAYLAPKAEQDRVASLIWNGGRGARNWDCWRLLGAGR